MKRTQNPSVTKRSRSAALRTKLLIIDDHQSVRQALEVRMSKAPEIELIGSTSSSEDGIHIAHEQKPNVALLEIKMADGSGLDTCQAIVAGGASVIILTSYVDEAERQAAFEAGAARYILKDIDSERLIKAIQAVCAAQNSQQTESLATNNTHLHP